MFGLRNHEYSGCGAMKVASLFMVRSVRHFSCLGVRCFAVSSVEESRMSETSNAQLQRVQARVEHSET
eukprot:3985779-Amphidinium_carterae.2